MSILSGLGLDEVFGYFEEICSMPHGSGNTKQISDYLCEFAKREGLYYRQDDNNNVVIKKDAQNTTKDCKPVILQGHIDMVAVKKETKIKDLDSEGLDLCVKDGYIFADGTSLGADDGVFVAYALAILANKSIKHPPIEAIFTVDEEIGMLGADALDASDIEGNLMINLDSEEEGVVLCGCAGGATLKATYETGREDICGVVIDIDVKGLTSGHSGTDIVFQRANANVIIGRLLFSISDSIDFRIVNISGGEKDNSIPAFAKASIVVDKEDVLECVEILAEVIEDIKAEYIVTDSEMSIEITGQEGESQSVMAIDRRATNSLVLSYTLIPDGVVRMSNDIKGLVQTSLNLGVVKEGEENIEFTYLVRSSVESEKMYLLNKIITVVELLGGDYQIRGVYPAWEYKQDSVLRDICREVFEQMYNKKPDIQTMHAGVECGILAGKIKDLDCISIGPDIKDIHTFKEKLDVESTIRTYNLVLSILEKLA